MKVNFSIKIFIFLISMESLINVSNAQYSESSNKEDFSQLFSEEHKQKYLWGTYKPNLYFSMREKQEKTFVYGIMWYNTSPRKSNSSDISQIMHHECNKKDNVDYYWEMHNGIDYGSQILTDKINNYQINTQYIKENYNEKGLQEWSNILRIKSLKNNNNNSNKIGLILYFSIEEYLISDNTYFMIEKKDYKNNNLYEIVCMKYKQEYAKIQINIENSDFNDIIDYNNFQKYRKYYNETWRVKQYINKELEENQKSFIENNQTFSYIPFSKLSSTTQPNIIAIQLDLKLKTDNDIIISVHYTTDIKKNYVDFYKLNDIETLINSKKNLFLEKFNKIFKIKEKDDRLKNIDMSKLKSLTIEGLSNIFGGIGYFFGKISEKNNNNDNQKKLGLFTATPCRSYFARGFLWDEGFHNILISLWDINLSIDIINSWLDTMNEEGWIPREQIRGSEAIQQVPKEFIPQDSKIANPPTLIFPIENIINSYIFNSNEIKIKNINTEKILHKFYNKLKKWYNWYEKTQKNNKYFQWYGRSSSNNYPSGFDDLPRAMIPNKDEIHLDLNIWMIELLKLLSKMSEFYDIGMISYYDKATENIKEIIHSYLFDEYDLKIYSDYLGYQPKKRKSENYIRKVFPYLWRNDFLCAEGAKNPLGTQAICDPYSPNNCCSEFGWCGGSPNHCQCEKCKKFKQFSSWDLEKTLNPHLGYVNLFPLFFGFLDINNNQNDKICFNNLMNYLNDENELLSNFGIRSLSKNDLLYHTGDDYWRGNIWININYLTLRGLFLFYRDNELAVITYNKIRNGLIKSIYNSWKDSHVFYEQYDDKTGLGNKNHPFNGWTSMIVEIISEKYLFE